MADENSLPKFKYHPNLYELGIADDLFEEDGSFDGWEGARDNLEKDGWISGLLFRCLHCGGYRLIVEAG